MVYYVDYENVAEQGLRGINSLNESDKVVIFLHGSMTLPATVIAESKAKIYIETFHSRTKNALDFTLAFRIGSDMDQYQAKDIPFSCCIISRDKGFLAVKDRIIKSGGYCTIVDSIAKGVTERRLSSDYESQVMELLSDVLCDCSKKYKKKVKDIIINSNNVVELNSNIMRNFKGTENGLFHKIKPIYQSIN